MHSKYFLEVSFHYLKLPCRGVRIFVGKKKLKKKFALAIETDMCFFDKWLVRYLNLKKKTFNFRQPSIFEMLPFRKNGAFNVNIKTKVILLHSG